MNLKQYNALASYASDPDHRLVRRVEAFLETLDQLKTPGSIQLSKIELCVDGSDFTFRADDPRSLDVPQTLIDHLDRSEWLLVFCSGGAVRSPFVKLELEWFLHNKPKDRILLAVTEGMEPAEEPETVFPPAIIEAGLHGRLGYDLGGLKGRQARAWRKVRDAEETLLSLAARLSGVSVADIQPLWYRDQRRRQKRRTWIAVVVKPALSQSSIS